MLLILQGVSIARSKLKLELMIKGWIRLKILIVEDEINIAEFIKLELEHEGYETDIAYDGREALNKAKKDKFDVIILDVMIPYINGVDICKKVREFSNIPIIMLTAKSDLTDKVLGLDSGANDYITKPFRIEELFARIRVVTRSQNQNLNKLSVGKITICTDSYQVFLEEKEISLTKKEYDLLYQLVLNKNIVMSREKLLQNVWDENYYGDSNVVDVTIKHLRTKIFDDKSTIINTIRGIGYVIKDVKD
ncbi:response regulator transcription factor [Acetobacterium sp. KB-1]|jgi:DNA-binding response OmpR family regulator|uniref:response regulator transcription factor n=1 Tax=Acetobacterium sp. KB-1 TaxID=2184575 RepID=UPI0026C86B8F